MDQHTPARARRKPPARDFSPPPAEPDEGLIDFLERHEAGPCPACPVELQVGLTDKQAEILATIAGETPRAVWPGLKR
jgi:hypothetical protein